MRNAEEVCGPEGTFCKYVCGSPIQQSSKGEEAASVNPVKPSLPAHAEPPHPNFPFFPGIPWVAQQAPAFHDAEGKGHSHRLGLGGLGSGHRLHVPGVGHFPLHPPSPSSQFPLGHSKVLSGLGFSG
ncbi:hypothetical protein H8959_001308 [Pygathrix nigripes]